MTLIERVREVLAETGKKNVEIAKDLGCTQQYIWNIFHKDALKPSQNFLKVICEKYEINFMWLSDGQGSKKPEVSTAELLAKSLFPDNDFALKTYIAASKMPVEWWENVEKLANQLFEEFQKTKTAEEPEE